ncbi:MAG: EthD domain-containing protein [Proteobacteria bacterium]|nr:EthD domain-containing protein [Pseudomonadota bacterium]
MFKVIGILKRPAGTDFETFKTWWLEEHSQKVKQWPGLVEYRINMSTTPDQDYDGVAEVWFDTREAMDAVFSTPEGQRARASATSGAAPSGLSILLTEEHVIV